MDTLDGYSQDPRCIYRYLYCKANPVTGLDPSGHEDLVSLTAATYLQVLLFTAAVSVVGVVALGYESGALSDNTKEQLPSPSDPKLEANRNSVFIVNSRQSIDAVFREVEQLQGRFQRCGSKRSTSYRHRKPNQVDTRAAGTLMSEGQVPFYVSVKKFNNNSGNGGRGDIAFF